MKTSSMNLPELQPEWYWQREPTKRKNAMKKVITNIGLVFFLIGLGGTAGWFETNDSIWILVTALGILAAGILMILTGEEGHENHN